MKIGLATWSLLERDTHRGLRTVKKVMKKLKKNSIYQGMPSKSTIERVKMMMVMKKVDMIPQM